jgi:hypothetical protein
MRIRATCKSVTNGDTRGRATRLGETMGEAGVNTQTRTTKGYEMVTEAKLRMFEDGSGLFEFKRGKDSFTIRWTEEEKPGVDLFALVNGHEGMLVPTEEDIAEQVGPVVMEAIRKEKAS